VITAYPSLEIAEKALKEGVKDFITKPFGVAEVADAVNRVVRDKISQQKKKFRERHRHLSIIDEIIGVYDREYFLETLNCEIGRARKEAMRISLLLIEIEGLSNIYADREEEYASKIVEEVAQIIVENIRDIDIVGRIDEEEFGVIIINVEKQEILEIAKRIKTLIESRRFGEGIGEQENKLLVNFGISLYQGGKDILEEAHLALRKAKEEGKVV
jgi:diguanylate cyclase (GGDEF)-like protein